MIGSVYRNQIPQAGFLELCLPLLYKFYPFENEILETLKQNSFIEDIVRASNRNSLMGADRHMRIKFLYTAGINYDGKTHLVISLKGLEICDEFRFCTRQRPGQATVTTVWYDKVSDASDGAAQARKHTATIFNGLAKIRMADIMHGSQLRGNIAREIEFYIMDVRVCLAPCLM